MKPSSDLITRLEALQTKYGRHSFKNAIKTINRRKIDLGQREPRKKFPWSKYRKLYQIQSGLCLYCNEAMFLKKGEVEIDHRDPNRKDFNADSNLQLLHQRCNRIKSSQSIPLQAKKGNATYLDLISSTGSSWFIAMNENSPMKDSSIRVTRYQIQQMTNPNLRCRLLFRPSQSLCVAL